MAMAQFNDSTLFNFSSCFFAPLRLSGKKSICYFFVEFCPLRLSGKKSNRNFFVEFCPLRLSGKNNKNFGK
jgi:hypothetical protein